MLGDLSAPQPDLALLRWRKDFYEQAHPGPEDILVLVEVAGKALIVHRDPENGAYRTRFRVRDLSRVDIAALPGIALDLRSLF